MRFHVLTIFPNLLESPLQEGIIRRALLAGQIEVELVDIRDFATDKHTMTDDRPFGGGEGMVMKPEPLAAAIRQTRLKHDKIHVVLLSPQGRQYNQDVADEFSRLDDLVLVCGRYEGVDERIRQHFVDEEISIGDYILTGGELAAMVIIDSVTRLLPGVLGCEGSVTCDTFSRGGIKYPQYTRPRDFEGYEVPEILLSGDHQKIAEWRFVAGIKMTREKRPDLLAAMTFSKKELQVLKKHGVLLGTKCEA
ncbi:MAG: tRNA (guanosine(37)-N1)-methyltransferase TrmD [Proteobacteria bacterium]|nr:tRNA (guanosine(37)-N1)-methyltransferase TrmD [Pseudomonadota bacterium]MBU4297402.1 tRNA (guanosine(37)-N1)-methyltransferase TrmD [Pseudomonadota bacterium]MCG2748746.1 tRNA (guanosine(37)-N1)-methyltransferase TrmD [Desulfobulbaceae bacterium]